MAVPDTPLLLIPTDLELQRLLDRGGLDPQLGELETCGFGPVAAAARSAALLAERRPSRVLLLGIAGAYDVVAHPLGEALEFGAVAIEGIGVGEGRALAGPPALGFPQWPGSSPAAGVERPAVYDRIALAGEGGLLLTTCAASADAGQAALRRERFPEALAEDMEGFAVALACSLAGVPLRIVRGISNEVGDRDPSRWRIPGALSAARRLAAEVLADGSRWAASP
jgi:futalosine hydrolase